MSAETFQKEDGTLDKGKAGGTAAVGGGTILEIMGHIGQASAQKKTLKRESAQEQRALHKEHRANIGTMLAQGGSSGMDMSAFQDLFNNQTIEDATQMAQLKQDEMNKRAFIKNKKRAAIAGTVSKAARASLGASA